MLGKIHAIASLKKTEKFENIPMTPYKKCLLMIMQYYYDKACKLSVGEVVSKSLRTVLEFSSSQYKKLDKQLETDI